MASTRRQLRSGGGESTQDAPDANGVVRAYPDTLVGTDSHTTTINGLGVLDWGVGGIDAEAAMQTEPAKQYQDQFI